ncbi:MAG TPA: tetratricopeptide repeat protein [Pirellulales bacterium]|nr:tetratricopeptide repeat protein [Pirellulales bacterium]
MDANALEPEDQPSPAPSWKRRLASGARLALRPIKMVRSLVRPGRAVGRILEPVRKPLAPVIDRIVRLPGAGLTWALAHGKLVGVSMALVLLLSVPLLFRQMVIKGIVPPAAPPTVEEMLSALDRHDWPRARKDAETLAESDALDEDDAGTPAFVLGLVSLQDAEQFEGPRRKALLTIASRYLGEAQAKGFPPGREQQGLFLFAKSLFDSDQLAAAIPVLEEGLRLDPAHSKEFHNLLAQIYVHGADRDLIKAKEHNTAVLNTGKLSTAERNEAWLRQCRILFDLDEMSACAELMAKTPNEIKNRPETNSLRGRLMLQEARLLHTDNAQPASAAAKAKYQQAIDSFRIALGRGTGDSQISRESMYLMGVCLFEMGSERAAVDQFGRAFQQFSESEEGVAAGFQQAELLRQLGKDDEAIAALAAVVKSAGPPEKYHNPWLSLDEIRNRLTADQQAYVLKRDFDRAIHLAEISCPIVPQERTIQLQAQGYRAWSQALFNDAEKANAVAADELRAAAREKLRLAGKRFAQLGDLRIATRFYPDDLWDSAEAALAGRDYQRAIRVVHLYEQVEPRRRRPQAMLILGEAHLCLNEPEPAIQALKQCLDDSPDDPATYRARILLAQAYLNQRDHLPEAKEADAERLAEEAEKYLLENLDGDSLGPKSMEYRDALFILGKLQYERGLEQELFAARIREQAQLASGANDVAKAEPLFEQVDLRSAASHARYEDAVTRLDEAVSRYPDSTNATEARYLMAEAYRHASREPRERSRTDTVESNRILHYRQMQQMLAQAATQYETLRDLLNRKQEHAELSPLDKSILRNAYFFHGAALFDAGRYEEAIHAYSTATNRYQDSPEVLEAYLQIASCYWRLNRLDEYQGTIEQARVVLKGMQSDSHSSAAFKQMTNYDRAQWEQQLNWLSAVRASTPSPLSTARNP